jgi:TolB-like protein
VGIISGALGVLWSRQHPTGTGERKVAVLPFENAGSADDEYFADGMTDEVRSRLSTIRGLRVTARASSSQYRRSKKTPRQIGRELEVQYLLQGTVRWSKTNGVNRVRVTPELIAVSNEESRWSAVRHRAVRRVRGPGQHRGEGGRSAERRWRRSGADRRASDVSLDAYDEF